MVLNTSLGIRIRTAQYYAPTVTLCPVIAEEHVENCVVVEGGDSQHQKGGMGNSAYSLFERLGGRSTLERVHKLFYDKAYDDPWLSGFFADIDQKFIEAQQTDFMSGAFGGPKVYCGRLVINAHKHIYITAELFGLRHALLQESIEEAGVSPEMMVEWLRIDAAFEHSLLKSSPDECERKFRNTPIVVIREPGVRSDAK